tara:strand:- start:2927 stop:3868 length:942 start_codon:yes stop_codon:yes gene_type:complete
MHRLTLPDTVVKGLDGALWTIDDCIGRGGQGNVYAATKVMLGCRDQKYAMKVIEERTDESARVVDSERILCRMNLAHPNLCAPVGYFEIPPRRHCIVLEALDFTLERVIRDPMFTVPGLVVLNHILRGIRYLHSHDIMHRDLKTSNVMFNHRGVAIIIDFGWATDVSNPREATTEVEPKPWTLWYRPPEVALQTEVKNHIWYEKSADLWPIGLIGIEMLWQEAVFPCKGDSEAELISLMCHLFELRSMTWENFKSAKHPVNFLDYVVSKAKVPGPDRALALISCSLLTLDPNKRTAPSIDFVDEGTLVEFKRQ